MPATQKHKEIGIVWQGVLTGFALSPIQKSWTIAPGNVASVQLPYPGDNLYPVTLAACALTITLQESCS